MEHLIGKRVKVLVKDAARDNQGKLIKGKLLEVGGIIDMIGNNQWMGGRFQIVIDRCPYEINHINDLKIIEKSRANASNK